MDRDADIRVKDFEEVDLGFSKEEIVAEAQRCIQCKKPKCVRGCPVGINIPAFIAAIAMENFQNAVDIIKRDNML
ncbi:MAG: dihydropyrimidine dehydrogenase, partial [Methanocorpusculum sp.]|nr:dihydropyrimidine dehydrogenase [Methanocorpusculum sp.]